MLLGARVGWLREGSLRHTHWDWKFLGWFGFPSLTAGCGIAANINFCPWYIKMLVLLLTSELVVYAFQIVFKQWRAFLHFIPLVLGDCVGLTFMCVSESSGDWWKSRTAGPHPRVPDSVGLGRGWEFAFLTSLGLCWCCWLRGPRLRTMDSPLNSSAQQYHNLHQPDCMPGPLRSQEAEVGSAGGFPTGEPWQLAYLGYPFMLEKFPN